MARPPDADPQGAVALAAGAPVVHTITSADLDRPAVALGLKLTQAAAAKAVVALVLGAVCFYYLHTGRRERDPGRLFWAAVFGVGTLLVLAV